MNTATFDVVKVVHELECMIYAGIVKDSLYSNVELKPIDKYILRAEAHGITMIDNYVYTYYSKWAKANNYLLC